MRVNNVLLNKAKRSGFLTKVEVISRQAAEQEDYQVQVEDIISRKGDGEDIQFFQKNDILNHWKESYASWKSDAWGKLPCLPVTKSQILNILSGNPSASDTNTFLIGDDFDTLDTGNDGKVWDDASISGFAVSPPVFADIDEDGKDEIIIAFGESGKVIAYDKDNGSRDLDIDILDVGAGINYTSDSLAVGDIDEDTHLEIVVLQRVKADTGGSQRHNAKIYCLNHDGTTKWTHTTGNVENFKTVVLGNFDTSVSGLEVACLGEGTLLMLDKDGNQLYYVTIDAGATYSETDGMMASDFNGDGLLELVLFYHFRNTLWKVRSSDGAVLGSRVTVAGICTGPEDLHLQDINEDGIDEIIFAIGNEFGILYGDLSEYWTKTRGSSQTDELCIADLDNDGQYEVFVGGKDKIVWCFNEDGSSELWNYNVGGSEVIFTLAAGDVTGDSNLEVLAGFSCPGYVGTGRVLVLDKDGNFLKDLHPDNESRDVMVVDNKIYAFNYSYVACYDYDLIATGKWAVEEGYPSVTGGNLELSAASGSEILRSQNLFQIVDREIRLKQKSSSNTSGFVSRFGSTDDPVDEHCVSGAFSTDTLVIQKYNPDSHIYTNNENDGSASEIQRTVFDTNYHIYRFDLTSSKAIFYEDSVSWEETTNLPDENMYIWLNYTYYSAQGISYTDWIFLRKYIIPEPLIVKRKISGKAGIIKSVCGGIAG